jgi:hypothetical protein
MGVLLDGVKQLQAEFECAAVLVHHTGWDKSRVRGSTALPAAMDVVIALKSLGGGNIEFKFEKMRDFEVPSPIILRLRNIGDTAIPERVDGYRSPITAQQRALLSALEDGEVHGATDCRSAGGLRKSTFYRIRGELLQMDAIESSAGELQITDCGRDLLSGVGSESQVSNSPTGPNGTGPQPVPQVPIPLGMGLGTGAERTNGMAGGESEWNGARPYTPEDIVAGIARENAARGNGNRTGNLMPLCSTGMEAGHAADS